MAASSGLLNLLTGVNDSLTFLGDYGLASGWISYSDTYFCSFITHVELTFEMVYCGFEV